MEEINENDDDCGANVDYDRGRCSADDAKVTLIDWERPAAFMGAPFGNCSTFTVHLHSVNKTTLWFRLTD